MRIKVGVNGYGVIGRRVAEAVAKQEDIELVVTETIDAIRALSGAEREPDASIRRTNEALGIGGAFL